jgi:DNA-directed RNA polymerase beta subunit
MDLLAEQLEAFEKIVQVDVAPAARRDAGLHGAFRASFPVEIGSGVLVYDSYTLEAPRWSVDVCPLREMTWAAPIKLLAHLFDRATGGLVEQEVYFGQIPLMTSEGTFIIEGQERVLDLESLPAAIYTGVEDVAARIRAMEIDTVENLMPHDLVNARAFALSLYKAFARAKRVREHNPVAQIDHVRGRTSAEPWASARVAVDPETPIALMGDEADVARAAGLVRLAGKSGELVALESGAVVIMPSDGSEGFVIEPRSWTRRGRRSVDRLVRSSGPVDASDIVFECDGSKDGKLAIGRNARVRFDASAKKAVVSATFANAMRAAEVFVLEAQVKDTRHGKQKLTPGPGLDESGIAPLGASVKTGDVIVGIASPDLTQLDPSLVVKKGIDGRVVRVHILTRMASERSARHEAILAERERPWEELARLATERSDPRWKALAESHESPKWRRDDLPPGVVELVRITIARETPLGTKTRIADRHGAVYAIARVDETLDVDAVLPGTPSAAAQREMDAGGLHLLHLAMKPPR